MPVRSTRHVARTNEIDSAIAYIASHPAPLSDQSLAAAAEKTAHGLDGSWLGNERPRYNEKRDKALVDLNFISGAATTWFTPPRSTRKPACGSRAASA